MVAEKKNKAEASTAEKAVIETQGSNATKAVKVTALSVTSSREGFRRAGYVFGKEKVTIVLSDLSKEQVRQINDDPQLTITEIEIEAE